jgi:threonine dehydrogenase-like Zn-dependent dehydrogenase
MKALALSKSKPGLHLVDLPEPKIEGPKHVLIEMREVGICRSDRELLEHHLVDAAAGEDLLVLGHEGHGVVREVGKEVKSLKKGDHVVPIARHPCGICIPCRLQPPQQDYCQTGNYTEHGMHKRHGFLTEFLVEDEDMFVKVPSGSESFAVLTEPVSILEKAMEIVRLQLQHVPWGCSIKRGRVDEQHWGSCKKALVFGLGQIGFSALMLLKLEGIDVAILGRRDESDRTVQFLKRLGAVYIDTRKYSDDEIFSTFGPFDVIIEATGVSDASLNLIPNMNRNAIYVMTGIPRTSDKEAPVKVDRLMRHIVRWNQMIVGTVNSNRSHFERALADMQRFQEQEGIDLAKDVITHRFPAFESGVEKHFLTQYEGQLKVVLEI